MTTNLDQCWATIEQARDYLAASQSAVLRLMISMLANPEPRPGWIRFQIMEGENGVREARLCWQDVLAIRGRGHVASPACPRHPAGPERGQPEQLLVVLEH